MTFNTSYPLSTPFLALCLCATVIAQDEPELPVWKVDDTIAAGLGEPYSDSRITLRPTPDLKKVDAPPNEKLEKAGIHNYGWTPDGQMPNVENISIVLTPYAKPSSDSLDKIVNGMRKSVSQNLQNVEFGEVQKGRFRGSEARSGKYTATISGKKVVAYFLLSIDTTGTFGITAMIPVDKATPAKTKLIQASIRSFDRVK